MTIADFIAKIHRIEGYTVELSNIGLTDVTHGLILMPEAKISSDLKMGTNTCG